MASMVWNDEKASEFSSFMVVNRGRSSATVQQYTRAANSFFTWAEAGGHKINPDGVREWLRHMYFNQGCMQNSTRAGRLSGLRTVCTWLMAKGILTTNPTDGVESPTFHPKAARRLDTATMIKLLNAYQGNTVTSIRNRAILLLLYATGMRRAELCSMTLERLTLGTTTGRVHIKGKGSKERTVGFRGAPVEALHRWVVARCAVVADPSESSLFVCVSGLSKGKQLGYDGLRRVLKRAAKIAGVRQDQVHLHLLRSTFATDLYDSGVPVGEIALLLGHSDAAVTWKRYIAISEKHLKKSMITDSRWRELGMN